MNRELRFRAWTENHWINQGMVYDWQDTIYTESIGFTPDDVPIMQFTGHRDRNGKEIYEGDILHVVQFLTTAFGSEPYDAVIEWDKYRWCMRNLNPHTLAWGQFPLNNLDPFGLDITVIGNVYENPSLVKGDS